MCGIAGIVDFKNIPAERSLIKKMADSMAHRGPDSDGFFVDENVAFAHRRLSIIDLSSAANQPFTDDSGRYVMVFNGEMYNYKEVKSLIADYRFHTTSDTEVLMAAYIKWGPGCIKYFRGMFAFAIWDKEEKEIFMARDRMGVKPLYYYLENDKLVFASEVRAILATGLVGKVVNQQALLDYFSYQSISYPHSLIEGISQLEAGSWIKLGKGKIGKKRYWDVAETKVDFDFTDRPATLKTIRQLMLRSVERRLVSDVPVGAFLSGGIDSSAVVGLMAEAGDSRPNTFNISFEEKQYDESQYAEIIARKFNTRHTRLLLKPFDFLDELQNALNAMDTPSGDGINTYVVSKAIRRNGMTVALSGVGGDELFAGYPFFDQYLRLQKIRSIWKLPAGLRRMAANLVPGGNEGRNGRIMQLLQLPSCSIDQVYPVFRQIVSPSLLRELTAITDQGDFTTSLHRELIERKEKVDKLPLLSQVSVAEYLGYTQHTLLKDTDQMGMAASLEIREPFFDQDLVEFVLAIPDDLKKPTYPKSLMIESIKPLLPDEVVFRRKQGFLFPWNDWLKNELRSFCDKQINNMAERPFIKRQALLSYWRRFLAGDKSTRWSEIWLFIVLEYWLERNEI
jgi:asparagine synthase (glutamine-hydrolysing)